MINRYYLKGYKPSTTYIILHLLYQTNPLLQKLLRVEQHQHVIDIGEKHVQFHPISISLERNRKVYPECLDVYYYKTIRQTLFSNFSLLLPNFS